MADLKWTWGEPLSDGYNNAPQEGYIENQPDAGTPFRRVRYNDIADIVNMKFVLTTVRYNAFRSWYARNTRQGSIPFDFYDCRVGIERQARIIGKPAYETNSKFWTLSLTISFDPIVRTVYRVLETEDDKLVTTEDGKLIEIPVKEYL